MKKLFTPNQFLNMTGNKRLFLLLLLFIQVTGFAQSPIYFSSGNYANPNNWAQGSAALTGTIVGTRIHTTAPNGTGNQYFRFYSANSGGTTYEPNGASDILLTSSTSSALQVTGSGKEYYLNIANASSNVVFKTTGSGTPGSSAVVAFEVQGAISTVNSVSQSPLNGHIAAGQAVNITATLSTALSTGQAVYLRYTRDGYATSTVVAMTGAGTTYAATIPGAFNTLAQPNVSYYVFTSGPANVAANGSNADFFTINLNNNGGSNYSYTVLAGVVAVASSLLPGNDAAYATLQDAFAAVNAGTHQGVITITITGNTAETASAVLNASGTGSASYTSVSIQPSGGSTRTVSGNIAGPLVDFNGADNVSINGLNSGGNALTFTNTSTSGVPGTSTIRFINSAIDNTLQNCTIQGSGTSAVDGVIDFTAGSNTGNIISGNTITAAGANTPINGIYSAGTSNSAITVGSNNIQDYYNAVSGSAGIFIASGSSTWTITDNKFFQTSARTALAGATHRAIYIVTGGGYNISNNVIGYANSSKTGTTQYLGAFANRFTGIELSVNATTSSVQNNEIAGVSMNTTSAASASGGIFSGIYIASGNVNVGNTTGNKIGVLSSGPISITCATSSGGSIYGISAAASGSYLIQNNTVTAFAITSATPAIGYTFYGIFISGSGNYTVSSNTIGSAGTANAVTVGSTGSTTAACYINAISCSATGTVTIGGSGAGNTIANLSLTVAAGATGIVNGINYSVSSGAVDISNNQIFGLSANNSTGVINGITTNNGAPANIGKNKIYDLSVSGTAAVVNGIIVNGSAGATVNIFNNILGDLKAVNITNNIAPNSIQGINIASTVNITANVYYNTVYLTGTASGTTAFGSAALYANTAPALTLRNNILINNTTPKGTGKAVVLQFSGTTLTNFAAASNNNLFYAGTPSSSNLIFFDGTNSDQSLASYKTRVSTRESASVSADLTTAFLSTTGSNVNFLHLNPATANAAESGGATISGFTDDYDGNVRGGTPDIGADEFSGITCAALPVLTGIATAAPYYGGDVITVNGTGLLGVTVATINGVNATVGTVTATTVQLTVPGGITVANGFIFVGNAVACGYSNGLAFTASGYITKGGGTGSGNWSNPNIWQGNAVPPSNSMVTIDNGDIVTLDISADPSSLTINATAGLTHQTNGLTLGATNLTVTTIAGTLVLDNAGTPVLTTANSFKSTALTVQSGGVFTNNAANASVVVIANFTVSSGGTYNHNAVGSVAAGVINDFPGSSSRAYGATSNVVITKWAQNGGTPVSLPASGAPGWGNLTINIASVTYGGVWNQAGNLANVQGNMLVLATGGVQFILRNGGTFTGSTTIVGNLTVSGGSFGCAAGTSVNYSTTISGNLLVNGTGTIFQVTTGSILSTNFTVSGAAQIAGTAAFSNTGGAANNLMNFGSLDITGTSTFQPSTSSTNVPTVNVTGAFTVTGGSALHASGTTYTYNVGSVAISSGIVNPSGTSSSIFVMNVTGNFSISGTGAFASSSSGSVSINIGGNYAQSSSAASAFAFQSSNTSSKTYRMVLGGDFTISNGGFVGGSANSPDSIIFNGGVATVNYVQSGGSMLPASPVNNRHNFAVYSGKTVNLNNSITPASGASNVWSFTVYSGGILNCGATSEIGGANSFTVFRLNSGATLRTAHTGGVFNTAAGAASITTSVANAILDAGATFEFNGISPQVSGVFATTPAATPSNVANMIINNSAGVTLTASYTVTAALQLQTGNLTLNSFNLIAASITGAPFSNTKMVVTNSTGALGQPVSLSAILFPVGNGGGYTPATFTFTANSTARTLFVRAVTPRNSNDLSSTDYINNRWWNTDLSVTTGTYAYSSSFKYLSGDVVGTAANIRLNRWTGSAWVQDAGSSVNTGTLTLNSGSLNETSGSLSATAQWVGRVYTLPAVYHWNNPAGGSWLTAANWTPTGVPGSGDGVVFDVTGGATYVTTNMPAGISLTQLTVSNNNNITLRAGASAGTVSLIFPGTATPQFSIAAGSGMLIDGSVTVNLNLPASVTGTVSGNLSLQKAAHTVTVSNAGALVFSAGSNFVYGNTVNSGFTGNPFGATGTDGSVIFQNGSVCETFEGSNPFGNAGVNITTFQPGSLFRYSDPNIATSPSISGRTYSNFTWNANKTTSIAAASAFICDSLTVTTGTFNCNLQGTPGHSIKGNINVLTGATLSFTPGATGTINMNGGGTQVIWGGGTFNVNALATLNIVTGTTVSLQKDIGVNSATGFVAINGTLICVAENNISSPTAGGTVVLNNGGTLSVQSINGISNTGVGNIRSTNFTYNTGGNFIYSGTANQVTGNRLPATLNSPSVLTVANTGTAPNNIVTLTTNNTSTPRINLAAGQFNAGVGGTLIINGGTNLVVGSGGNQYLSGTASDNIIRFASNGAVSGTPELWNVVIGTSGTGVDFQNNARINGTLFINSGGFVVNNAPKYNTGSNLAYNTGGNYDRNMEWGNNSGLGTPGYPHHVTIQNGTTLNFLNTTTFDVGCGGNLNIGSASSGSGSLVLSNYAQPYDLYIAGNLNIGSVGAGTLTLSNSVGCDIFLTGNWTRSASGTVNFGGGNGRSIYLEGSTDATITASGGQYFPYIRMQKAAKATKVTLADHVSIGFEVTFTRGTLDLGTNNKFFTLLSNANYDARVDVSDSANTAFVYGASDNTGQFIIQRYMPARRAWRLVNAPLKPGAGTHSISQAWQEQGNGANGRDYTNANWAASVGADSITAAFGTQITGGTVANGFDQSPNNASSIKYFAGAGVWSTPANTNNTSVNSVEGWLLFVRGDRKNYGEITNQLKAPTVTTLRPRGQIFIGQKTITSSGMTTVGNPYASAVDYFSMIRTGTGWPANPTYYVWDPSLGGSAGVGAFVTLTWNGSGFTRSSPYGPGNYDNRYIPSGAAIMVEFPAGGGTLSMNESNKNTDSNTTAFRPVHQLMTVLQAKDTDSNMYVADGVLHLFGDHFSNGVDMDDARKLSNVNENLCALRDGNYLSVERKKINPEADTIFYFMNRMQRRNYRLLLKMEELELPLSTTAFLEDDYLKKKTPVSLAGITEIDFAVTAEAASAATGRFKLVFRKSIEFTGIQATLVNNEVLVNWGVKDEWNIDHYEVERSSNGVSFYKTGEIIPGGDSELPVSYSSTEMRPAPGEYYYRIKCISKNGAVTYSGMATLKLVKDSPALYVFPNPVINNEVQLQLNKAAAGEYQVRLMNSSGQVVMQGQLRHSGGTATHSIKPGSLLVSGVYQLEVTTPGQQREIIKVMVNNR